MKFFLFTIAVIFCFISCENPHATNYIKEEVIYKIEVTGNVDIASITYKINNIENTISTTLPWIYTFDPVISYTEENNTDTYYPSVNWEYVSVVSNSEAVIDINYYRNGILLQKGEQFFIYKNNVITATMNMVVHIVLGMPPASNTPILY